MDFFGIDLTRVPQYSLAADNLPLLIFPILAVVTMFISTHISMKASGQEMQGSMKLTMYMMPLMYVFFCFTVPCAFSLYYVISNIVMTVQTQVMRKIYDPEKMKEQVKAEIASRRKEEKRGVKSTTIKVKDEKTGEVVEKNISASEMNKRRLEYARQQDAERYKDERTVPLSELETQKGGLTVMIRTQEATGKTVDEARINACALLGVEKDDINVSYEVLEMPQKTGFLGLKLTPAKVRVSVELPDEPVAAPAAPAAAACPRRGGKGCTCG